MSDLHLALLRGINVGGKNKLPMAELTEMFTAAGCSEVRTYIQSGNIVFRSPGSLAERIPERITEAILDRFNMQIPVITRTADELREITRNNPFLQAGADQQALHVVFLRSRPDAAKVASLDPHRSSPDRYAVRGREIYLHCPNGFARTKLTNDYFDRTLSTTSTVRNWRTVLKLLEMAVK
ncbi:MAG: DUF1697 domain-containing protein [bacterium]